jgi:hypothetical protein
MTTKKTKPAAPKKAARASGEKRMTLPSEKSRTTLSPKKPQMSLELYTLSGDWVSGTWLVRGSGDYVTGARSGDTRERFMLMASGKDGDKIQLFSDGTARVDSLAPKITPYEYKPLTDPAHEAEHRKHIFQTEMAINIGMGLAMVRHGSRHLTIMPGDIADFVSKFNVTQEMNGDGSYTITVASK